MRYKDEHKYDDIINMPHHVSKKHPQMSLSNRAAQFSPFAALTGHEDAIEETARLTEKRLHLDENTIEILDFKLQFLKDRLAENPVIDLTYFRPDEKKQGGSYETVTGMIKKIDLYEHRIVMDDGCCVPINDIVSIHGEIFNVIDEVVGS